MTNGEFKRTEIKGYTVEIFGTYYGDDLYITKDGRKVYSARVAKNEAMIRAVEKVTALS